MKHLLTLASLLLAVVLGWTIFRFTSDAMSTTAAPPVKPAPQAVQLVMIERRDMLERVELVGSLEPRADVTIRSRTRGYITGLPFDVGDRIVKNDQDHLPTVVELDDSTAREMLRGAEAALQVAEAQLTARQARLAFARNTIQRQAELARSGATSDQELDQATSELAVAEAEVKLEEARVAQAASEVERNRLAMEQSRLLAPLAGFVAERLVEVGDLANPDDPLLRIVDLSQVRIVVHVVEQDYERMQVGQTAEVTVDAFPDEVFEAVVERVAPVLDPETRTAAVHIEIDNSDGRLKPGMHARVGIVAAVRRQTQVVPAGALLEHSRHPALFVVRGEPPRAEMTEVTIGLNDGEFVEVLSGLNEDARIVALGSNLLEDGQAITPVESPATSVRELDVAPAIQSRDSIPHVGG